MAMLGSMYMTMSAFLFDRGHHHPKVEARISFDQTPPYLMNNNLKLYNHVPVFIQEFRGVFPVCIGGFLGKAKKLDEKISNVQLPKLAPQFDGLNCLETFVAH
ncbi:hypothetical protein ACOSQ2_031899 [Xanthoceras sorbifolium]